MVDKRGHRVYRKQDDKLESIGLESVVVPEELLLNLVDNTENCARVFASLRKFSKDEGEMPTQNELAELLGKSRPVINVSLQMLRLNRYLVENNFGEQLRGQSGRFTKLSYTLYSAPLGLSVLEKLDPSFPNFVQSKLNHSNSQLAERAKAIVQRIGGVRKGSNSKIYILPRLVDESPCKKYLHGLQPSTTSTSTEYIYNLKSSTTQITKEREIEVDETRLSESSYGENDLEPTIIDLKPRDAVGGGVALLLESVPKAVHAHIQRLSRKQGTKPDRLEAIISQLVRRLNQDSQPPIQNIHSYTTGLFAKEASGELYEPEKAKRETKQRRESDSEQKYTKTIDLRAEAIGLTRRDGESNEALDKRISTQMHIERLNAMGADTSAWDE